MHQWDLRNPKRPLYTYEKFHAEGKGAGAFTSQGATKTKGTLTLAISLPPKIAQALLHPFGGILPGF